MEIILINNEKYSFSPDKILDDSYIDGYEIIDDKVFRKQLNLFYSTLSNFDLNLKKKKFNIGLKKSIVNEIFINSSVFYFINF